MPVEIETQPALDDILLRDIPTPKRAILAATARTWAGSAAPATIPRHTSRNPKMLATTSVTTTNVSPPATILAWGDTAANSAYLPCDVIGTFERSASAYVSAFNPAG